MNRRPLRPITDLEVAAFERDGAICLRGLFDSDWVERLRSAVDESFEDPKRVELGGGGGEGRFHTNLFMWARHPDIRAFALESPAAWIARALLRTKGVRFYYDHLFVKEPGTRESTPWHHDQPYWPVAGAQVCSVWLALDPVSRESSGLEYVRGSHRWPSRYRPEVWGRQDDSNFAGWKRAGLLDSEDDPIPDLDREREKHEFLSWDCEPCDCLVHHALAIHGSSGNGSAQRRRALSTRWTGDDARYAPRPGSFAPLLDPALVPGQPLESPRHPLVIAPDADPTAC